MSLTLSDHPTTDDKACSLITPSKVIKCVSTELGQVLAIQTGHHKNNHRSEVTMVGLSIWHGTRKGFIACQESAQASEN